MLEFLRNGGLAYCDGVELLNGFSGGGVLSSLGITRPPPKQELVDMITQSPTVGAIGSSDAHVNSNVGRAMTAFPPLPGHSVTEAFFEAVRSGRTEAIAGARRVRDVAATIHAGLRRLAGKFRIRPTWEFGDGKDAPRGSPVPSFRA